MHSTHRTHRTQRLRSTAAVQCCRRPWGTLQEHSRPGPMAHGPRLRRCAAWPRCDWLPAHPLYAASCIHYVAYHSLWFVLCTVPLKDGCYLALLTSLPLPGLTTGVRGRQGCGRAGGGGGEEGDCGGQGGVNLFEVRLESGGIWRRSWAGASCALPASDFLAPSSAWMAPCPWPTALAAVWACGGRVFFQGQVAALVS